MKEAKRTPLYDVHVKLGARMIEFGGWMLPVQYSSIKQEHQAVRERAGLFDVSHMGEFEVKGPGALEFLQRALTNDFASLEVGRIRYSPMCEYGGGTLDDLLVYRMDENEYMLVVNASRREADFEHLQSLLPGQGVTLVDRSDEFALIAIQGPRALEILSKLSNALPGKYYSFEMGSVDGIPCIVSRTGYTGEDGAELYVDAHRAGALFERLLEAGGEGVLPCGLGARDTLRFEASMPLYGHELTSEITPHEAGLGMFVKPGKGDFVGMTALLHLPGRRRVGMRMTGRGIAREGCRVTDSGGKDIGFVTSGMFAPTLNENLAMALVDCAYVGEGEKVFVIIREKPVAAEIVAMPFYKRNR